MQDIKEYKLIKNIGKGSFGEVYLTKKGNSPKLYATKIIPYSNLKTEESKKYLKNEIKIMQQLDHPNIIKLYDVKDINEHKYLVSEKQRIFVDILINKSYADIQYSFLYAIICKNLNSILKLCL